MHRHIASDAEPPLELRAMLDPTLVAPPKLRLAERDLPAEAAYALVEDDLLLDGSARMNLATGTRGRLG